MKIVDLNMTTSASSSAANVTSSETIFGHIEKVVYTQSGAAAEADLTLTCEDIAIETILVKANIGTAAAIFYPRTLPHKAADGSTFTNVADRFFVVGKLKAAIAEANTGASIRVSVYLSD